MKSIIAWILVLRDVLKFVLKLRDVFQTKESVKPMLILELALDVGRILVQVADRKSVV